MTEMVRGEIADPKDPSGHGRVRIRAPLVLGEAVVWAEVLRPGGGAAPRYKRGDVVMIAFEGGDARYPVVLGAVGRAVQP
jgi:hypothetical protein